MFMEKISEATNSIFAKIILGLVAVSFVLSGVAGYMFSRGDTFAVKVNGDEISQHLFQQRYEQAYQEMSERLGQKFAMVADSPEFTNKLKNDVLNRLIDQTLLNQYMQSLKLGISDRQIETEIVRTPVFQKDGKFDNKLYQQILANNGINGDIYAQNVRQSLRLGQFENGLFASDFITPKQLENLGKAFFQKRDIRIASYPIESNEKNISVSEGEIKSYYDSHQNQFSLPETVNVQYIDLTHQDAVAQVKVTDVEIAQYYQDNKMQYLTQHLAHIQVANKEEADRLYADLEQGANFADLAKEFSTDKISAKNGGDLDWVTAGMMPEKFEKAAIALKPGQYSKPILVDNSYHIIKVEEEKVRPLEEVKAEITKKLRNELAVNKFYAMEKELNEKAFESLDSLEGAAKAVNLPLKETGFFSKQNIPAVLNYGNVISAIFDSELLQGTMNSEAMNVGDQHSIVIRVLAHKPARIQSLSEVKESIVKHLKFEKAQAVEFAKLEKIVKELNDGSLTPENLPFGEQQEWTYATHQNPVLLKEIFAMPAPKNGPVYIAVKNSGKDNVVIVELSKIIEGELNQENSENLMIQLNRLQQINLGQLLLDALRQQGTIDINQDFMNDSQN